MQLELNVMLAVCNVEGCNFSGIVFKYLTEAWYVSASSACTVAVGFGMNSEVHKYLLFQQGDGVGKTIEENSSIFSLTQMH